MSAEAPIVQPVFDPQNIGASLDIIQAQIPRTDRWLAGTILGETVSRRKGMGSEIDGVRDYVPLDDPRHIDWGITARQPDGTLQVRDRYKDITPTVWIVTDALQSRNAANPGYFTEQNLALSAATGLMRMAQLQRIPAAVIASDDYGLALNQRKPGQGRKHIMKTARALAEAVSTDKQEDAQETAERYHLADLLRFAGRHCSESIVVIVSDFRDVAYPDQGEHAWGPALDQLARKRNDIIAVETTNIWDTRLPLMMERFRSTKGIVSVGSDQAGQKQRDAYESAARNQQTAIDERLAGVKAHHAKLSTAEPLWRDSFCDQLRALNKRRKH